MADNVNLSLGASFSTYTVGQLMTVSLSGTATSGGGPSTTTTVTANALLSDGTVVPLTSAPITVVDPATNLTAQLQSVTDTGGRAWTINSAKTQATATA